MRRGIVRLKRERLLKQWERLLGISGHRNLSVGQSAQIQVIGVQVFRALTLGTLDLRLAEAWLYSRHDAEGDLILEREDVAERAIVSLGPDMGTGRRLDELASDADAVASLAQAAFEHVPDAEFAADLLHVDRASFIGKAGIAGYHKQPFGPRQPGDDVFDD